jgi:hypothetical protein
MKKGLLVLAIAVIVAGGVFAQKSTPKAPAQAPQQAQRAPQQAQRSSGVKNWFSGEISIIGLGLRYERMLSSKMGFGVNVYYDTLFFLSHDLEAGVSFRGYPWGGTGTAAEGIYFGGGLGFHMSWYDWGWGSYSWSFSDLAILYGGAISFDVGWRIDVGSRGGFFIEPGVKFPLTLGMRKGWSYSIWDWDYDSSYKWRFDWDFTVIPYIGLGVAF